MNNINRCSLGFAFYKELVFLILKSRPLFQKDKLNGIGGKVEVGESYRQCMVREFSEEALTDTSEEQWKYIGILNDLNKDKDEVAVFTTLLTPDQYKKAVMFSCMVSNEEVILPIDYTGERFEQLDKEGFLLYNVKDLITDCLNELGIRDNKDFIPRVYKNHEYSN
jgi:8-oxo-dGTP pyrophosphatase MutT (NUDIX family)